MTRQYSPIRFPHAARGAVLFVALVFLVLLTLLGLTAASTSVLQERMTGGMRNGQLGLMGAESAARGAESALWNLSQNNGKLNCFYNGGDSGFCYSPQSYPGSDGISTVLLSNPKIATFRTSPTWLSSFTGAATYALTMNSGLGTANLAQQPQYILEYTGKVTAPGTPLSGEGGSAVGRYGQFDKGPGGQDLYSYRITSRSTGGSDASVRVVETYFGSGVPSN
jgi:type IV pilus assembly protein PilX